MKISRVRIVPRILTVILTTFFAFSSVFMQDARADDTYNNIIDALQVGLPHNELQAAYDSGKKHLVGISGRIPVLDQLPPPAPSIGVEIYIDIDDYFGVTEEGYNEGWVTLHMVATEGLGQSLLPADIIVMEYDRGLGDLDLYTELSGPSATALFKVSSSKFSSDGTVVREINVSTNIIRTNISYSLVSGVLPLVKCEVRRSALDAMLLSASLANPGGVLLDAKIIAQGIAQNAYSLDKIVAAVENPIRNPATDDDSSNVPVIGADPFVDSVWFDPELKIVSESGNPVAVLAYVTNLGDVEATCDVDFYADSVSPGNLLHTVTNITLPPHDWLLYRVEFDWDAGSLSPGEHRLISMIRNSSPSDANSNNNQAYWPYLVSARPNAAITSISPNPATRTVNSITFTGSGEDPADPENPSAIAMYRWELNPGFSDTQGADVIETTENPYILQVSDVSRLSAVTQMVSFDVGVYRESNLIWSAMPATAEIKVVENTPPPVGTFLSGGTVESPILAGQSPRYSIVYRNTEGTIPSSARVIINGTTYNMNAISGDYTTGKLYAYEGRIFSTAGSSNTYYFEFVVGGETERYPETGTLSGPVVENPNSNLLNGRVEPAVGDLSQTFTYYVTYQSDDGRGPKYDSVALFVDGAAQGINMWRTIPNNDDWENGVEFKALVGGLAEGTHEFHFSCAVGTSQHNVRYPESGEASGPTVGEAVGLQVTITPHASYDVGDWAEFDIAVRDENGDLTDPDEWEFWRMDNSQILYAEDTAVSPPHGHTGTGTYFLKDYNSPLTAGYHRYKMVVWKDGYPRVDKFLELPIAVTPDVPIRITDIDVSPTHFKPGSGDVSVLYDLSADAYVRVDVYDTSDNFVKTIAGPNAFRAAGSHTEIWNGTDSGGSPVGVGQYRFEVWARADVSGYGSDVLYDGHQFAVDGSADNLTNKPSDILYDRVQDQVIITEDYLNDAGSKTQRFTVDGTFVANFPSVSGMYAKNAVAQDTDGNYYVQDIEGSVFKFNSSYASQGSILNVHSSAEHAALATLGSTYLYAADNNWGQITRKDLQGGGTTSVAYPHSSWQADGIAVDEDENVWVAYSAPNNVVYKYDKDLTYLNVSFPFGLSTAGADLCVKHGNLLYMLLYAGTLKVYDIKNEAWLSDISVSNTRPSAIEAAENGYTFVNFDDGDYNAMRYRDRISADSNFALVEAVAVVPDAEITAPTDSQTVGLDISATVTISGTAKAAAGTTFDRYMLEVGQGVAPTEWGLIVEGDAEVEDGILGEWNLNGVWDGDHTIRLRVFDTQGVVGEDRVTVDVQAPNQPPETYANGDTLSADSVTVHLSARDDTTPDENVEYSWQLNHGAWSAYTTETAIALTGIGNGQNTFRARAKDTEGLIDQTPATLTIDGTVDHAPNTPVNIYPFGGQPDAPLTPTLIGSVFRDADPSSAFDKAQFQIRADGGDYSSAVFATEIDPGANYVSIPASTLQNTQSYWFRCRYRDDSGQWSAWSVETKFTVSEEQRTAASMWMVY